MCIRDRDDHIRQLESRNHKAGSMSVIAMDKNGNIGAATNLKIFPFTAGSSSGKCEVLAAVNTRGNRRIMRADDVRLSLIHI